MRPSVWADALAPVEITVRDWSWTADVVISPMALGDHVDHYLTREAARRLLDAGRAVAFYEDRPYACILTDDEIAVKAKELDPRLVRRRVSGPMGPGKHRRMWYPSQFSEEFLSAIASDEAAGRQPAERLVLAWYPRQRLWRVAFYVDGVEQDATLCSSLGSAWRMVRAMRRHHHRHSWWARGSR